MDTAARAARIAEIRRQMDLMRDELVRLMREAVADEMKLHGEERAAFVGLTIAAKHDTIDTVDATETVNARLSRAKLTATSRKHPFVRALVAAGETTTEAARKIGYARTTIQSWYRTDDNGRPIPRAAAEKIRKLYGVPLSAWPRITE